jgi:hypothetical protein
MYIVVCFFLGNSYAYEMEQSVPKRRHIQFRPGELPRRKHTTFRSRLKFEIKKSLLIRYINTYISTRKHATLCVLHLYARFCVYVSAEMRASGTWSLSCREDHKLLDWKQGVTEYTHVYTELEGMN